MKVNSSTGDTLGDTGSYYKSPTELTEQEDGSVYPDDAWPEQLDIESQGFSEDVEVDKPKNGKKKISSTYLKYFHTIKLNWILKTHQRYFSFIFSSKFFVAFWLTQYFTTSPCANVNICPSPVQLMGCRVHAK